MFVCRYVCFEYLVHFCDSKFKRAYTVKSLLPIPGPPSAQFASLEANTMTSFFSILPEPFSTCKQNQKWLDAFLYT